MLAGKEDPVEFDSSLALCGDVKGVDDKWLADWFTNLTRVKYHCLHSCFARSVIRDEQTLAWRVVVLLATAGGP